MARVFVSHASEDDVVAAEVHEWLVQDNHDVFLDKDLRDGSRRADPGIDPAKSSTDLRSKGPDGAVPTSKHSSTK